MLEEQATETKIDEPGGCRELAWQVFENEEQHELNKVENTASPGPFKNKFEALLHVDQNVYIEGKQVIGKIVKLLPGEEKRTPSYVVVHSGHLLPHQKLLPVRLVTDASTNGVWLSIDRAEFNALPEYRTDEDLTAEVESVVWNDEVLRFTAYHVVDIRVKDGVVSLTGYIKDKTAEERIEWAINKVEGVLGVHFHLIADDILKRKVAEALTPIDSDGENRIYAEVEQGVVVLSGEAGSLPIREAAQRYAVEIPGVRGVINDIAAPGVDPHLEDQRFLQPSIGEVIFFHDSLFGYVKHVVINPENRRVVRLIIQGQIPDWQVTAPPYPSSVNPAPERMIAVPASVIRYLTNYAGFLTINSTETDRYEAYDPNRFTLPPTDWVPPYPYCTEDVRFMVQD